MKLTIIREDGFVSVNGVGKLGLVFEISPDIHAVQFSDNAGWIEFVETSEGKPQNQEIFDVEQFAPAINAWSAAIETADIAGITIDPNDLTTEQKRALMRVTPFQAKAVLLQANLLDDVEALISDPVADPLVKLAWANALEYRRLSPMVEGIKTALGWTDEQLDSLFEQAVLITA